MATVEGTHTQGSGGRTIRYRAEYEVVGSSIHFRATFDGGNSHEGQFDFDPGKLDAAAAVDAFLHNHIEFLHAFELNGTRSRAENNSARRTPKLNTKAAPTATPVVNT